MDTALRTRTAGGTGDAPAHEIRLARDRPGQAEHVVTQLSPHRPEQRRGDPGVAQGAVMVLPAEPEVGAAVDQRGPAAQAEVALGHAQGVHRGHPTGDQATGAPGPVALGPQEGQVERVDVVAHHHPPDSRPARTGRMAGEGRGPGQHRRR